MTVLLMIGIGCSEVTPPNLDWTYVIQLTYTSGTIESYTEFEYDAEAFEIQIYKQERAVEENAQWYIDHNVQLCWFKYNDISQSIVECSIVDGNWITK